uniref:Uncharacterized protein n=1 Tax=Anguilla anguilla TaxID=7936 RepID=A0A0E9TXK7_ANGAN
MVLLKNDDYNETQNGASAGQHV